MKFAIIQFPGSNCDRDCVHAIEYVVGESAEIVWHKTTSLEGYDVVILPGGFSYGDYLRPGAIAKQSPIMQEVIKFANNGKPVIGICNGFQVLTEAGLLLGALTRNNQLKFICDDVYLKVENCGTQFTKAYKSDEENCVIRVPIAHMDGCYVADDETLKELEDLGQVVFRYAESSGNISADANVNGSANNIAGIINGGGNVLGLMPHPERVCEDVLGGHDGIKVFESLIG